MNFYFSLLTANFSLLTPDFNNFHLLRIVKSVTNPNLNAAHSPFGKNS
ncbi:hypothetical protein NIES4072_52780 [Nostoc commune NIES-4072]|uniref:Uncharacterized protein n=1 Tax=Nostoc commune NIES-4072 TaxID=2005467 RepID=A0A2R5G0I3_NOSCO|nr:hypothetical protein NIES4070_38170 [Nostoc commune HK-02]GBG21591.1 hypothetical protein NIES4072_52780 [Nostoc commune NIES-4072]